MKVWILSTFDRDDEACDHEYDVISVYDESNKAQALSSFYEICKKRINKGDKVELDHINNCYFFSTSNFDEYSYEYMVRLQLQEVKTKAEEVTDEEMYNTFMELAKEK